MQLFLFRNHLVNCHNMAVLEVKDDELQLILEKKLLPTILQFKKALMLFTHHQEPDIKIQLTSMKRSKTYQIENEHWNVRGLIH